MNQISELFIAGKDVTEEELAKIEDETPAIYRFQVRELLDKGIYHLLRIKKEFWKAS